MATNKHALLRYEALDRCLRNRQKRYYIEDLVDACCAALSEYSDNPDPVHKRQVQKDIDFIEEHYGLIEKVRDGRRVYYRYEDKNFSINNSPITDEEINKLQETILMLGRFKGMPQFEWMDELIPKLEDRFGLKGQSESVMDFEQNLEYSGSKHLSALFNAIINKQPIHIKYRKFDGSVREWNIHPYYLKQYNNRWFLFGRNDELESITNVPLDRIEEISLIGIDYKPNTDIDFREYFDDVIGVSINDCPLENIVLKFAKERYPYIVSKPLHGSMKFVDPDNCIVQISVIPNRELEALIYSFGDQVEVLSPQWFRDKIAASIKNLSEKYSNCVE